MQYQALEEQIQLITEKMKQQRSLLTEARDLFSSADIYTVENNGGSVEKYDYFLYPFKGYSLANTKHYKILAEYLARMIPKETEVIVSIESDGIGIATLVAAELELPLVISKHFHYNVPCAEFTQTAGYHSRTMYLPKVIEGKKVALVDCMVSTGGTIQAMVEAIKKLKDVEIMGTFCVNDKNNYRTKQKTLAGYPYKYLISTNVTPDGKSVEAKFSWDLKKAFWQFVDQHFYELTEQFSAFSNKSKRGYGVGSIIVDAEKFDILAWGFRRGNLHAEQDAINMLKLNCPDWQERKLSLYSTMEPCIYRNDVGQRPCAEMIGTLLNCKWVVIGSKDSADQRIYEEGIQYLLEQGKCIRLIESDETFRPVQKKWASDESSSQPETPLSDLAFVPALS